jgi:hypothetical protein
MERARSIELTTDELNSVAGASRHQVTREQYEAILASGGGNSSSGDSSSSAVWAGIKAAARLVMAW